MEEISISKKKVSIINLAINYANTFFLILNGLVLVPIYFKFFSLNVYGSYLASANIAGILGLLEFGLSLVLTQKLSILFKKGDYVSFSKLMGAGLTASLLLLLILVTTALTIRPFVPIWVKASIGDYKDIQLGFILNCLGIGLNIYSNTLTSIFQAWSKVQISGIVNVVSAMLGISGTILGLYLGFGVASIALGIFIKGAVCTLSLIPFLIVIYKRGNYPTIKIEREGIIAILKDSLPLFGNTISKSLIENGQLLIITSFINPSATAIYALTSKVYLVCSNLLAPIGSSIFSSLSQLVGENNIANLKANVLKVFTLFTIFSTLIISISFVMNTAFVALWVGADKFGGIILSLILCVNVFISTRFDYLNFNLFALGIFGKTLLYDQLAAILRIILIFILIKVIGIVAVPIAELVSTVIFCGYFLNKLFVKEMQFNKVETTKILLFGLLELSFFTILGLLYQQLIPGPSTWTSFIIHGICISFIICGILVALNRKSLLFIVDFLKNKALMRRVN